MIKYQIVEDLHKIPGWEYAIERIDDDREPVRFLFEGTREKAEAAVRKLNNLVRCNELTTPSLVVCDALARDGMTNDQLPDGLGST